MPPISRYFSCSMILCGKSNSIKWHVNLLLKAEWGREGSNVAIDPAPQHGEPPLFCAHLQGFSPGSTPAVVSPPSTSKSGSDGGSPKEVKAGSPSSPSQPPSGKDKSTIVLESRAALIDVEEVIIIQLGDDSMLNIYLSNSKIKLVVRGIFKITHFYRWRLLVLCQQNFWRLLFDLTMEGKYTWPPL